MSKFPDALPGDTVNWTIPNTSYLITGHSRAGERTGFCLPSSGIFFDAGMHCWNVPKAIFISHSHSDHCFELPMITADLDLKVNAYAPLEAVPVVEQHLLASAQLNACSMAPITLGCSVIPVAAKDSFPVKIKSIDWHVDIVACDHRVPSVGYCISEIRTKLKEEYKGLPGKEIAKLKKAGTEISERTHFKQFAFMGDTTTKLFEMHPEVLEYSTIFVECTHFKEGYEAKAAKTTHVHWSLLKPIVKANPQCLFMLIHFSLCYGEREIDEFFTEECAKENISNVGAWLDKGVRVFNKEEAPMEIK